MCSITFSLPEAWYFCNVVKPPHDCRNLLHLLHAFCGEEQQAVCQIRSKSGPLVHVVPSPRVRHKQHSTKALDGAAKLRAD